MQVLFSLILCQFQKMISTAYTYWPQCFRLLETVMWSETVQDHSMQDHEKTKTDFFWSQTGPVLREEKEEEEEFYLP